MPLSVLDRHFCGAVPSAIGSGIPIRERTQLLGRAIPDARCRRATERPPSAPTGTALTAAGGAVSPSENGRGSSDAGGTTRGTGRATGVRSRYLEDGSDDRRWSGIPARGRTQLSNARSRTVVWGGRSPESARLRGGDKAVSL